MLIAWENRAVRKGGEGKEGEKCEGKRGTGQEKEVGKMDAVRGSPDEERKKGKEKNARNRHERENRPPREKGGRGEEQGWTRRGGGAGRGDVVLG